MALAFTSCRSVKTTSEKNKTTAIVEKLEVKKDSTNITKISEEIKENVSLSLRTNNKVVDSIIKQRLKGFATTKTSGGNSYAAKFDYDKMVLDISAVVAESINETSTTDTSKESEKSFTEQTDEYFSKKISAIPFWIYILVALYFLPKIIAGVTAIINPLQTVIGKVASATRPKNT